MIKTSISELFSLVHSLVQADNGGHVVETEVGKVVVRRVKRVAILNATLVVWTSKGQELAWQDPVEVTIFHLLKVFILVRVEVGEVKKAKMNSLGDGCKAVLKCEVVTAPASRGISEWRKGMAEGWAQQTQHLLRSTTLVDDHVASNEIGGICSFTTVKAGIVYDLLGALELFVDFLTVAIQHGQIERSEIIVEIFVDKFIVDAEVVARGTVSGF